MAAPESRKTKRRRLRKRKRKQYEGLRSKVEQRPLHADKIVIDPSGAERMSEVLLEFVEPYLEFADTEETYQRLLMVAVMAWNASLFPEGEGQDMIDRVLQKATPAVPEELKTDLGEIVSMLIARKRRDFSEYTRAIVDFELTDTGSGYRLLVASTMEETRPEQ